MLKETKEYSPGYCSVFDIIVLYSREIIEGNIFQYYYVASENEQFGVSIIGRLSKEI